MSLVHRSVQLPWAGGVLSLVVTAGLVAGCSGGSPAASAESSAPVTSTLPSEAATESPSTAASASESAAESIAADADLAELLPATLGGASVTVARFDGDDLTEVPRPENQTSDQDPIGFGMGSGGVATVAEQLDVPTADVQGAMAYAPDHEPISSPHAVIALRALGADPAAMLDALGVGIGGMQFFSGELTITEETVGGKTVSVMEFPSYSNYIYTVGDVAFIIKTDDPAEAEEVLGQLP